MRNRSTSVAKGDETRLQAEPIRIAADAEGISRAADIVKTGGLVAFPTETVYGLGADATSDDAVLGIFEAKGRPRFNPLIVHVANREAASRLGVFDDRAQKIAAACWPGALTLVVPLRKNAGISDLVTAGLDTIAIRIPAGRVAQTLLRTTGIPVAAPSANPSGQVSATTADDVADGFAGQAIAILDGWETAGGLESSIVAALPGAPLRLLRPGLVTRETVAEIAGEAVGDAVSGTITAPGQLRRHYAPAARLRLNANRPEHGEAFIAFGPAPAGVEPFRNLSDAGDLREAAAALFRTLRDLDAAGHQRAAFMPIPDTGLGEAINDRLRRAAAEETDA